MAGKKGKKAKGGKKGKKSRKGKKGKKGAMKEPQMTPQEAILAYQINVIEQKLEDILYETRGWEERNQRNRIRNDRLKQEEENLLKNLLKANRSEVKLLPGEEIKTREDVVDFMKETWRRRNEREEEIEDIKRQITRTEEEIQTAAEEVSYWRSFQQSGQHKLQTQIKLLEQELADIEISFEDMAAYSTRDNEKAISAMQKETEEILSQQKDKASERAMDRMNKKDRQEMLDNNWLNREVAIHRVETEKVRTFVEMLERENLQLMSELFDCSVEDLKVSSFFLTQFADSENLDHTGILEIDLAKITVPSEEEFEQQVFKSIANRPKSAVQKAVEDKVFSLASRRSSNDDTEDISDDEDNDQMQSGTYESCSVEEGSFEDYLQLGPLELKLLSVTGQRMPIHKVEPPPEELESKKWNPDEWPVTVAMLKGPLLPEVS
ncbi:hypothetical protein BsWGS_12409 [Bradybaena similaris]